MFLSMCVSSWLKPEVLQCNTHTDPLCEEVPFYLQHAIMLMCVCVYSHLYSEWGLSTTMCGLGEAVALFDTYAFMDFSCER